MLQFRINPQLHEVMTHGQDSWTWDGVKWAKHDRNVQKVVFDAKSPMGVDSSDDNVTYKFDLGATKKNARLFEMDANLKTHPPTGEIFYTFSPFHTVPDDVVIYLTRGMRYVFKQPMEEWNTNPLQFYENKAGSVLFGRKPWEFIYEDGIIVDQNILTFHPKPDAPDTLLYGAENGTRLGMIYLVDKYN